MKSDTSQRLAERTALITGAGSPAGIAICERFAREGAWIVAVDGDPDAAEAAAETARAAGAPAIGLRRPRPDHHGDDRRHGPSAHVADRHPGE